MNDTELGPLAPANAEPSIQRYNVYVRDCPARLVFDRLADKWALLIVRVLQSSPRRFNQLRRDIDGITQKALSQSLQKLERDGVLNRAVFPTVPVTVEYSLTTLGSTLATLIAPLSAWAENHIDEVLDAQRRYDARKNASD